jgi:hypothetical protein
MKKFDIDKSIDNRLRDLDKLCEQRDYVERMLFQVNLALRSLARDTKNQKKRKQALVAVKKARRRPAGLTEAISEMLRDTPYSSLSANEVRHWLERGGFDLSDYSQPLATISVTLRRLAVSGRVKAVRKNRRVTYQWIAD